MPIPLQSQNSWCVFFNSLVIFRGESSTGAAGAFHLGVKIYRGIEQFSFRCLVGTAVKFRGSQLVNNEKLNKKHSETAIGQLLVNTTKTDGAAY